MVATRVFSRLGSRRLSLCRVLYGQLGQQEELLKAPFLGEQIRRWKTTDSTLDIREKVAQLIPEQQARLKELKTKADVPLGNCTVGAALGGMRGLKAMVWDVSNLDAEEGIRFRGYSIPECQAKLPSAVPGGEPLPEGLLWLLLTGEVPTKEQANALSEELRKRSHLPAYVAKTLDGLPANAHPMSQLTIAVMALQSESIFAKAYQDGIHKSEYWKPTLEDSLNLIAKLPAVAALIYRRTFHKGKPLPSADPKLDWAANYAHMMGYDKPEVYELIRLYLSIHSDHEGGNVSAHTTHLVGSALGDPYVSYAAGMNGLAGPLHGLANQEVLRWILDLEAALGPNPSADAIRQYCKDTLAKGKVVPGYGHAVLRKTDPRYMCQREFALKHLPDYPLFKTVSKLYEVVPEVLLATGKVKNPWPNVDAHSGVLLQYYGITEET
eukprot:jgi/Mesvir1/937/Mv17495-RA.2